MGSELKLHGLRKDGKKIPIDVMLGPFVDDHLPKTLVVARDITEIKKTNEAIQKSLQEKETLLKEVHHRVKNNLAIISSLLQLQTESTDSQQIKKALSEGINRIKSIALVHEQLYQRELFSSIQFDKYISELIHSLKKNFNHKNRKIDIRLNCHAFHLSMEKAVPCALIINEIVTNSFKHGHHDGVCKIDIHAKRSHSYVHLYIKDHGKGYSQDILKNQQYSLGLTLINVLSVQLKGKQRISNSPGATFEITFPRS
jgi:two-component system, sensor histidine kinase PdtaS